MSMTKDLPSNGVEQPTTTLETESVHMRRQRSQQGMKFSLYPANANVARPRTTSNRTSPPGPLVPGYQPRPQSPRLPRDDSFVSNSSRPSTSHNTPPTESPRAFSPSQQPQYGFGPPQYGSISRGLQERPSEASRLRALNSNYRSPSSEGRRTPEVGYVDNFSRPRQPSLKRRNESPNPLLHPSHIFPLQPHNEGKAPTGPTYGADIAYRDRGHSASSYQSVGSNAPAFSLRPSASIPDYQTAESIYSRQRNLNNSSYRPGRGISRPDSNYSPYRREPLHPPNNQDEEVRASFRSALTTNSSFLGGSGTERSSIATKSSSTSIYGRDEGMSVDDAIGMYEGGFHDSGTDAESVIHRPSADSERGRVLRLEEATDDPLPAKNNSLLVPSHSIIRSSAAMLDTEAMNATSPMDSSDISGPLDVKESYLEQQKAPSRPTTRAAPTSWDNTRDRYGFRKATQYVPLEKFEAWNGPYTEHLARRRKKWVMLLKDNGFVMENPQQFPAKSVKVKRFVRKGIPPDWRGAAWFFYAGGPSMLGKHPGVYANLIAQAAAGEVSETDDEIIERDLNRTFPDNIRFKPDPVPGEDIHATPDSETPILQSLRRVLQAFAIYNPKIGYCQSLNFLAGLLLLFMEEEKAFWMLNIITRIYLPGTHELSLEGANVDLGVLMLSIKDMMPQIWAKIGGELDGTAGDGRVSMRLPPITLCTTAWFMSCFIGTLPIETTLRVWDSFFYEGSKTLFRIALTIFKVGEQEIKAVSDPMEIFQVVQTIPRKLVDANALLEACFKRRNGFGHISQDTIEKSRAQRRQGYADERAKAAGEMIVARKRTIISRKKGRTAKT